MNFEERNEIHAKEYGELTDAELMAMLEDRHMPTVIPPCRVCGEPLDIGACGGGKPTVWACSPLEEDPDAPGTLRLKSGRDRAEGSGGHYSESRITDGRHADPYVMELVRRYGEVTT